MTTGAPAGGADKGRLADTGGPLNDRPGARRGAPRGNVRSVLLAHAPALPAYVATALMVLWAAHDGGYDTDTWYWGALLLLSLLFAAAGADRRRLERRTAYALAALALYVVWSYASIAWAGYAGDALTGSNRTLLYFLIFTTFALVPWRPRQVLGVLSLYTAGVGVIAAVLLWRMVAHHSAAALFSEGRLISPTGYFNSNAALFMAAALLAVALSSRRELPVPLRGLFAAVATAGLELALLAQSRGWLFTLPLVLLAAVLVTRSRLRLALAAALPAVGALASTPALLDVYRSATGPGLATGQLVSTAGRAGRLSLLMCGAVFVAGTIMAALDRRSRRPPLAPRTRQLAGVVVLVIVLGAGVAGATTVTHGHPFRFLSQQWHGFIHPSASSTAGGSHFANIGTGRYDAWRVAVKAALAHPLGGLGQDNFADYYVRHRQTGLELQWTHSLEMRLLAHTGFVGTVLFGAFFAAALAAALAARSSMVPLVAGLAGIAVLPMVVWLIHGSVDWFWEIPALSGPALGFTAMAGAIRPPEQPARPGRPARWPVPRLVVRIAVALGLLAAVAVLGLPYLSVREVSLASDARADDPSRALSDLSLSAKLNPLSADPGRIGGTIALQVGLYEDAERRFEQSIRREPGGWYAWLGAGLAASAAGDATAARRDFETAASINSVQPAVKEALARVGGAHPLTPAEAFRLLVLVH